MSSLVTMQDVGERNWDTISMLDIYQNVGVCQMLSCLAHQGYKPLSASWFSATAALLNHWWIQHSAKASWGLLMDYITSLLPLHPQLPSPKPMSFFSHSKGTAIYSGQFEASQTFISSGPTGKLSKCRSMDKLNPHTCLQASTSYWSIFQWSCV